MKKTLKYTASFLLLLLFGLVSAADPTEIVLSNKDYLLWDGSDQYFDLCNNEKAGCLKLKMPKDLMPIEKLTYTTNITDTRATWLVSSGEKSFICAVSPNSVKVSCTKVLNAPQTDQHSKKSTTSKKVFAEARAILDGELAFARYHSDASTDGGAGSSTCTDCNDAIRAFNAAIDACETSGQGNSGENLRECGYDDISFCYAFWQTINAVETYFCLMNIPELPAECK